MLKFYAAGDSLAPDFEAQEAGIRRFIGRSRIQTAEGRMGFKANEEPDTVPFRHDYVKMAKAGDLRCADKATAMQCGVKWVEPAVADEVA